MPEATQRVMEELQRSVARLQAQVDEMRQNPPTAANDEELFDGDYQPPFRQLQSRDEEDAQIRNFFQSSAKVCISCFTIFY